MWLETLVGEFAPCLRDVSVTFWPCADYNVYSGGTIRAQFHSRRGLQVTGSFDKVREDDDLERYSIPMPFFGMPTYFAALEKNRIVRNERTR